MSKENARNFLTDLKNKGEDNELIRNAAGAKTEEDKLEIASKTAKEMGYDVTAEELKDALAELMQEENDMIRLDAGHLEEVAGGVDVPPEQVHLCECGISQAFPTGRVRKFLLWENKEYRCVRCRRLYWY